MKLIEVTPDWLIEEYGGSEVAKMCEVSRVTPYQWKRRKRLSPNAVLKLSEKYPRRFKSINSKLFRRT